jgi:hypothetical protein
MASAPTPGRRPIVAVGSLLAIVAIALLIRQAWSAPGSRATCGYFDGSFCAP